MTVTIPVGLQGVHRRGAADADVDVRPASACVRGAGVPAAASRAAGAARGHAQQPRQPWYVAPSPAL